MGVGLGIGIPLLLIASILAFFLFRKRQLGPGPNGQYAPNAKIVDLDDVAGQNYYQSSHQNSSHFVMELSANRNSRHAELPG